MVIMISYGRFLGCGKVGSESKWGRGERVPVKILLVACGLQEDAS